MTADELVVILDHARAAGVIAESLGGRAEVTISVHDCPEEALAFAEENKGDRVELSIAERRWDAVRLDVGPPHGPVRLVFHGKEKSL